MKHFKFIILLSVLFIFTECDLPEEGIDSVFIEYVDLFIQEAADRGQIYDYSDIRSIRFGEIENQNVRGTCNLSTNDITIDPDFWFNQTESFRTSLIFHELGHCVLGRNHIDAAWPIGICKSIMTVSEEQICIRAFRLESIWYDYYTDELFDMDTPTPDWYRTEIEKPILETLVDTIANTTTLDIDLSPYDFNRNFEILALVKNWHDNEKLVLSLGSQKLILSDKLIYLESIFLNRDPIFEETTLIRFVNYDGLDYIFIDGKMFLIDNLNIDFTNLNIAVEKSNGMAMEVEMELKLNLLED